MRRFPRSWTLHLSALAALLTACAVQPAGPPAAVSSARPTPEPGQLASPADVSGRIPTQVASVVRSMLPRAPTSAPAAAPTPDPRLPALATEIDSLLQEQSGAYGVTVEWVPTHQRVTHDAQREFESTSVYKLAVAYEVLSQVDRGQLALGDQLTITDDDAVEVEPEGGLAPDDEVSVWAALEAMKAVSSNSAAHALMRLVGRADINASLQALGLQATRIPEDDDQGPAVTSAADMARLLELLADNRVLSPESRQNLRTLLALPEDLDPLIACLPTGTEILSKTGNQERASNIAGLVSTPGGPLIISVFDEDVDPGDARTMIEAITQATWRTYAE
jgi:beta-lactamase class A